MCLTLSTSLYDESKTLSSGPYSYVLIPRPSDLHTTQILVLRSSYYYLVDLTSLISGFRSFILGSQPQTHQTHRPLECRSSSSSSPVLYSSYYNVPFCPNTVCLGRTKLFFLDSYNMNVKNRYLCWVKYKNVSDGSERTELYIADNKIRPSKKKFLLYLNWDIKTWEKRVLMYISYVQRDLGFVGYRSMCFLTRAWERFTEKSWIFFPHPINLSNSSIFRQLKILERLRGTPC